MNWITEHVAIGNYLEALDVDLLRREQIASALSLDGTLYGKLPEDFGLQRVEVVSLEDAPGNDPRLYVLAVDTLIRLVQDHAPVLVQCHAGRSRSVVVVAGYLVKSRGLLPHEAVSEVAAKREIAITSGVERLLDHLEF